LLERGEEGEGEIEGGRERDKESFTILKKQNKITKKHNDSKHWASLWIRCEVRWQRWGHSLYFLPPEKKLRISTSPRIKAKYSSPVSELPTLNIFSTCPLFICYLFSLFPLQQLE
jgi:hypothetical protein